MTERRASKAPFSHRPLHLAVIHQQTGVIQQLIHTLLSSQQQNILNTANHLQQVALC